MQGVKKTEFLYIFSCIFYIFLAFLLVFRYTFVALSFWRGHFFFHADRRMHFPAFHRTDQIQNCQDSRISCKNSLACHRTKRGITDQHKNIREKNSVGQHCPGHKAAQQTTGTTARIPSSADGSDVPLESVPARRPKPPDLHGRFPDVFQFHTALHFPSIRIITEETALQTATESKVSGSLHY